MIPAAFAYHRPRSVDEAIALLAQHREEARVVAGGHSLIPMMKLRLARPAHLLDLQDLDELRGIHSEPGAVVIGAMTTQHEMISSELLAAECPIIRETSLQIGDPQVRYCGTLGGNVANGDPGNDMPAVMIALDASYRVKGPQGERDIPARDFYRGIYSTTLAEGEILLSVRIATPPVGHGYAYEKQKRKTGDYATAAAAVVLTMSGGACASAAIALTNVGPTPLRARAAEAALRDKPLTDVSIAAAANLAMSICDPAGDQRGDAEYKTAMAGEMTQRALRTARSRIGH